MTVTAPRESRSRPMSQAPSRPPSQPTASRRRQAPPLARTKVSNPHGQRPAGTQPPVTALPNPNPRANHATTRTAPTGGTLTSGPQKTGTTGGTKSGAIAGKTASAIVGKATGTHASGTPATGARDGTNTTGKHRW